MVVVRLFHNGKCTKTKLWKSLTNNKLRELPLQQRSQDGRGAFVPQRQMYEDEIMEILN